MQMYANDMQMYANDMQMYANHKSSHHLKLKSVTLLVRCIRFSSAVNAQKLKNSR